MPNLDTLGWQQRVQVTVSSNSGTYFGTDQTNFLLLGSHKVGGNIMANIIPLSFYSGINRASTTGKDIRATSDTGLTEIPFHLIEFNPNVDSGTTTTTTVNKLIQSGQNFLTTVKVGDRVFNITDSTTALVTSVDSNTQLTLDADITPTAKVFLIVRFYFATKRTLVYNFITSVYLWCGNSNATLPAVTDTYGRNNVYNAVANPYLAQWFLNEPSATDAQDSTGNGWLGSSAGTSKPASSPGIYYQGQYFNAAGAVEDRFNISGSTTSPWEGGGTSPPGAFTISAWIKRDGTTGTSRCILSKRDNIAPNKGFEFRIDTGNTVAFSVDMGTNNYLITSSTVLANLTWYMITAVMPSNGLPSAMRIYVNGTSEGTGTINGTVADSGSTTSTTANKLVQTGQNFLTTCTIGDVVFNTTDTTYALITAVDSNTTLSLSVDIMTSGESFQIYKSSNLDTPETVGIGSREGSSSVLPFLGDIENMTFINAVAMDAEWVKAKYNNVVNMSLMLTANPAALYNQFPDDYSLLYKSVCRSLPTYIGSTQSNYISVINELQVQNTSFWNYVQNGGGNIVICTNLDGTGRIPIDVASCDTSTKKLSVFLKRTITFGGGDYIYIFFKVTNDNLVYQPHFDNTNGRNETYSHANYKLVMHLNEAGSGVVGEYKDSTGTLNDGQGTVAPNLVDAVIGKGQQGNATTMKISIGNIGFPYGKAAGTMSAWAIFTGDTSEQTTLAYGTDADGQRRVLQQRSDGCGGHVSNAFWGVSRLYSGKTHVAWLFPTDAGTLTINETRIFINGVEMLTSGTGDQQLKLLTGTNLTINTVDTFSQLLKGGGGTFSNVPMDEMRLTTNELSADWIKLDYFNQLLTTNLWALDIGITDLRGRLKNINGGYQ